MSNFSIQCVPQAIALPFTVILRDGERQLAQLALNTRMDDKTIQSMMEARLKPHNIPEGQRTALILQVKCARDTLRRQMPGGQPTS